MTERRTYHCRRCGQVLFETDVPLGTDGNVYAICKGRRCREFNPVGVGKPPWLVPKVWTEWNFRASVNGSAAHDPAPTR
jgi:hypothetical protein